MGELTLAMAGLAVSIAAADQAVTTVVRERYQHFLSDDPADWHIDIEIGSLPGRRPAEVAVSRDGASSRLLVERSDFAARLDLALRTAAVRVTDHDVIAIDSFLRIACSLALLEADGFVVHAASLIRRGRAYLFCGPSGSGKTTVARLSDDAVVLSDDLSVVTRANGRALAHRTPFRSEPARAGEAQSAPLAGIYFLRKAERHGVEPVGPRRALAGLLPNVVFFAREADLTARVLDISADLVERVACFDLAFRRDPGFWRLIDGA